MDNTLNGEKSIKNEDTVSWLMAQHEKNKISFSFPESLDYAEKPHCKVPFRNYQPCNNIL